MPFVFREDNDKPMPPILGQVLDGEGWDRYDEEVPPEEQPPFNLFWKTNRFFPSQIQACKYPYQRVNHYPKSSEITKKDAMYRHMKRMKGSYGAVYNFVPTTFVLPNEYVKFCQYFADEREKANDAGKRNPAYICKPSDLSRGRKIFVFDDIGDLTYDCSSVVQKYIPNPLLVKGHKFDLRIYVLVTSFQPLRAYIYDDFLARFGVEAYNLDEVRNIFAHLTNYSISKNSTNVDEAVRNGIGALCKWESKATKEYFAAAGIDFDLVFQRIENLVSLTLLSICNQVPSIPQCFELYGFDVLLDTNFQPWLVEVNFSPALATDSDLDAQVKGPLMRDLVNTLHIQPFEEKKESQEDEEDQPPSPKSATPSTPKTEEEEKTQKTSPTTTTTTTTTSKTSKPTPATTARPTAGRGIGTAGKTAAASAASARGSRLSSSAKTTTGKPTASSASRSTTDSAGGSARVGAPSMRKPLAGGGAAGAAALRRVNSTSKSKSVTDRLSGSSKTAAKATTAVEYVDRPEGKFRWVFPFSPETEEMSIEMGRTLAEPLLRQLIGEVKKKEAKAAAAMKGFAKTYADFVAQSMPAPNQ